jgi:hypothetical protein
MRFKNNRLIAVGIGIGLSSIIFTGCCTSSCGFLNLGVADALRKSKACVLKQKLAYANPLIAKGKFALPTLATRTPAPTQSGTIEHNQFLHSNAEVANSDCGCHGSAPTSHPQYYTPSRSDIVNLSPSGVSPNDLPPSEIVEPPVGATPLKNIEDAELPNVNPLPGDDVAPMLKGPGSKSTEGTLEPIGRAQPLKPKHNVENKTAPQTGLQSQAEISAKPLPFIMERHENVPPVTLKASPKVADTHPAAEESIFEAAKSEEASKPRLDEATQDQKAKKQADGSEKAKMITLHARPAQSHHLFTRDQQQQRTLELMQASHRNNFRRQNSLRKPKFSDMQYRQAMNTDEIIDFKPLPPVKDILPLPKTTPRTLPLPMQSNTPAASEAKSQNTPAYKRRPILRATTTSSASILSLKNLANVIGNPSVDPRNDGSVRRTDEGTYRAQQRETLLK